MERAKTLWKLRWSLLKKPAHLSLEEKQAIAALEREDTGFVQRFRHIIRQLVNIFDHTHSEAQARIRLKQLRQDITTLEDRNLEKILTFFDDHWEQAFRYLRKKGMGKHRRGSNSESGMRLLRRLEKNHDGIRSATTRQHYIQIYQAMKYLSLDQYLRQNWSTCKGFWRFIELLSATTTTPNPQEALNGHFSMFAMPPPLWIPETYKR